MVASITPSPPSMCKKQKGVPGILSFFHRNIYFSIVLYWGDISYFVRSYWRGKGNICTFIYSTWQLSNKDVRTRELRWKHSWFLCLDCLNCASTWIQSLFYFFVWRSACVSWSPGLIYFFIVFGRSVHSWLLFFLSHNILQSESLSVFSCLVEWVIPGSVSKKKKKKSSGATSKCIHQ